MTSLEPYALVRVPFPFSDREAQKRRPAVVLTPPDFQRASGHLLLAMVTSARQSRWPLDWPIQDLAAAGLSEPCLVRLKLFTLDERLILGTLGQLSTPDRDGVRDHLLKLLDLQIR
ncbi:type II toxin-antitoxin system PemK/MazF family toxin [Vulcanococcus limneticus]|uniref:type II toxin-antitoxin system PemK/MazF family toxin n=1 Tax=Vulcanococcus limneticus TaxID=2170428 RepID=UPI00398C1139